jgi:hypothetical protein
MGPLPRAWGLWLVLTMLSYEASEEKLKARFAPALAGTPHWPGKWMVFPLKPPFAKKKIAGKNMGRSVSVGNWMGLQDE